MEKQAEKSTKLRIDVRKLLMLQISNKKNSNIQGLVVRGSIVKYTSELRLNKYTLSLFFTFQ